MQAPLCGKSLTHRLSPSPISLRKIRDNIFQYFTGIYVYHLTIKSSKNCLDKMGHYRHLIEKVNRNVLSEKAKANLDAFIEKLNVEVMDSSQVDVERIFDDYFSYAAPFENNEKKRKEFPDAFIAAQIRKRFSNNDLVAIISNDNGFKKACGKNGKMLFFDSLGQLYNLLSKEEKTYSEAVSSINDLAELIGREIESIILDNDSIAVAEMSYDKDGIAEGYDYDETYVEHISNMRVRIHTIDEIQDNQVFATLLCTAKIQMSCFFEDYDNAAWDSDTDSYIFVETRKMIENHNAKFAIRIEYNLETKEYSLSKFKVFLGGDTRTDRFEITDEEENDYVCEIEDMDRESVGLVPFSGYESFLEENLVDCDMQQDIISRFERISEIYQCFEELVAKNLPVVSKGDVLSFEKVEIKEGKTSPPKHFTDEKRANVFIVDDTLFYRTSYKKTELGSRVCDHVGMKFRKGFRLLTLGWSDGNTFIPVNSGLVASSEESNIIGPTKDFDKRFIAGKCRKLAQTKAPEVMLSLLDAADPNIFFLSMSWLERKPQFRPKSYVSETRRIILLPGG